MSLIGPLVYEGESWSRNTSIILAELSVLCPIFRHEISDPADINPITTNDLASAWSAELVRVFSEIGVVNFPVICFILDTRAKVKVAQISLMM